MRIWAEERKLGTTEILLTLPVPEYKIVLGKFLGTFLFLVLTLAFTFLMPVIVRISGPADLGVIFASYIRTLFFGASLIALGMWVSAMTENQIIAFIFSIVLSFFFLIMGTDMVLQPLPSFMTPVVQFFSLFSHFASMARGVLDSRDIFYFLSFIAFFLFLNVQQIRGRRFD
jgi:ABC-2 type transport system permease protein